MSGKGLTHINLFIQFIVYDFDEPHDMGVPASLHDGNFLANAILCAGHIVVEAGVTTRGRNVLFAKLVYFVLTWIFARDDLHRLGTVRHDERYGERRGGIDERVKGEQGPMGLTRSAMSWEISQQRNTSPWTPLPTWGPRTYWLRMRREEAGSLSVRASAVMRTSSVRSTGGRGGTACEYEELMGAGQAYATWMARTTRETTSKGGRGTREGTRRRWLLLLAQLRTPKLHIRSSRSCPFHFSSSPSSLTAGSSSIAVRKQCSFRQLQLHFLAVLPLAFALPRVAPSLLLVVCPQRGHLHLSSSATSFITCSPTVSKSARRRQHQAHQPQEKRWQPPRPRG